MEINHHYNITLTKSQKYAIYKITDNKDKQNRLMSIYQYCIKYTDKSTGMLSKTIGKLFTMYSAKDFMYHNKISRKYFYTLVDLLIEKKLIFANKVHKRVHKTVHKTETVETIENASVESNLENPNKQTTNRNTYIYTPNTSNDVIETAKEILKEMNVKSKVIKNMVMDKLANINLDSKGMLNYIYAVILDKIKVYYKARDKYKQKIVESRNVNNFSFTKKEKKARTFNNFEAREMYDNEQIVKDLENKLTPKESTSNITELLNNYKSK